ncbi:MAG: amidohydrolase family protein [Candidatus Binatia bacterium]|nr:amidohydrolase family protein [Candidatus Binatia bacterium]
MKYDLLITNGLVVDGTGLPRRRADVAIRDGKIVGVGHFEESLAEKVLDVEGRVVAPGIIDPHTHYDPQLTFDPYGTSSCYHGVTTVLAGNCGFSIAPVKEQDRAFLAQIFTRVEDMAPDALDGIPWTFESFPEFLKSREGQLGINAAFYVGHCNIRRWVMGEDSNQREATPEEIESMRVIVGEAMEAGAAGLSSTHAPTHLDAADRPVPSRLASKEELEALVKEVGLSNRGSISYLPYSSIGGLDEADGDYLIDLALGSRLPIIIQGLGARNKVDAPTATWEHSRAYLERARGQGAGVYSMLMARPFNRRFTIAEGTGLYDGCPAFARLFVEAATVEARATLLRDESYRDEIRDSVESPNTDPAKGSTLPPPHFDALEVYAATKPENQELIGRPLRVIASERGVAPMDLMVDIALSEDLAVEFIWRTETEEWKDGTLVASQHPNMVIGTSDGGAHLGRDDGAEFSSYFLRYWVREWGKWELEEAIRQLTQQPAALLGLQGRGMLLPGYAADIMIFDPDTIGPGKKEFVHDFPNGVGRWSSRPEGVYATIVNGVPIVIDGALVEGCGYPGNVVSPGSD